jgi:hypothetical protein
MVSTYRLSVATAWPRRSREPDGAEIVAGGGSGFAFASMVLLASASLSTGCNPDAVIGTWACAEPLEWAGEIGTEAGDALAAPWSTGFEEGFCEYKQGSGFCYSRGSGSYELVTSPVHSGQLAAAFTVSTDTTDPGHQARCVRQGLLPTSAYYGAWYYVPSVRTNSMTWNLIHFEGGDSSDEADQHGLWDVSLVNVDGTGLRLAVYSFLGSSIPDMADAPLIPIGSWFHVEFYLRRAADATGEIAVYQDGTAVLRSTDIVTDNSRWGKWYVGNFANDLTPTESTVYVDDVTLRADP